MKPLFVLACVALAAVSGTASPSPMAGQAAASSAGPPAVADAARPASGAASSACPARSAPSLVTHRVTSKARHTIDDADPCADPHSPPPLR